MRRVSEHEIAGDLADNKIRDLQTKHATADNARAECIIFSRRDLFCFFFFFFSQRDVRLVDPSLPALV